MQLHRVCVVRVRVLRVGYTEEIQSIHDENTFKINQRNQNKYGFIGTFSNGREKSAAPDGTPYAAENK